MSSPMLSLTAADNRPRPAPHARPTAARPTGVGILPARSDWHDGRLKPVIDRVSAVVLLVVFLPVVAAAAAAVRLTSRGPAFYTQTRSGRYGRPFRILKLRTMYHECERQTGPRWSTPGDDRITPVGRFLRRSHIDELPQLVNVFLGHMSLVGPRPERPELIPGLEAGIPGYRDRLSVRPGVTGLAQLWQPADTDLNSVRRKLVYDRQYITHAGLWTDTVLMLGTAAKMFGLPPVPVCRLLGLGRFGHAPSPEPGR
jgi:lipopolysaccharide/colanic/teichoic acid biosynthesis glycosyltransferase